MSKQLVSSKNKIFFVFQEFVMTEHFRMSGIYWGLTAIDLLDKTDLMQKSEIVDFVKSCQHSCGGFSPSHDHDPHILYTLSAVQVV